MRDWLPSAGACGPTGSAPQGVSGYPARPGSRQQSRASPSSLREPRAGQNRFMFPAIRGVIWPGHGPLPRFARSPGEATLGLNIGGKAEERDVRQRWCAIASIMKIRAADIAGLKTRANPKNPAKAGSFCHHATI